MATVLVTCSCGWQISSFIIVVGALALTGHSGAVRAAEIQSERGAVEQCGAHSEAGMPECLAKMSYESSTALKHAEAQAIAALSKWDEDAKYVNLAKEKLKASSKAYERYRDAQCAFASSLGGGAIGNALEMRRLSCLVGMNARRIKQLDADSSTLPAR
jgi:uncharacterized protein YecT (DUF1311 family)